MQDQTPYGKLIRDRLLAHNIATIYLIPKIFYYLGEIKCGNYHITCNKILDWADCIHTSYIMNKNNNMIVYSPGQEELATQIQTASWLALNLNKFAYYKASNLHNAVIDIVNSS